MASEYEPCEEGACAVCEQYCDDGRVVYATADELHYLQSVVCVGAKAKDLKTPDDIVDTDDKNVVEIKLTDKPDDGATAYLRYDGYGAASGKTGVSKEHYISKEQVTKELLAPWKEHDELKIKVKYPDGVKGVCDGAFELIDLDTKTGAYSLVQWSGDRKLTGKCKKSDDDKPLLKPQSTLEKETKNKTRYMWIMAQTQPNEGMDRERVQATREKVESYFG